MVYASTTLKTIRGMPRIASDQRPAAIGAARAKAPSAINRAPATRLLNIPDERGMGRYLYAIDVKVAADGKATGSLSVICEVTDRPAS